jgi:hypothetical protein
MALAALGEAKKQMTQLTVHPITAIARDDGDHPISNFPLS